MCTHEPTCPSATSPDRDAAVTVHHRPEQGWARLCNGVTRFDDTGELLPDGCCVPPCRVPVVSTSKDCGRVRS
ncbi:DUF5999 family protein [Streptomyces sp. NPDC006487]|uniref:DUF5999 family protein n=1 Tax=Streptomyces sp. NPDC006487 TaxID=3364748 RepID=UPI003697C9A3